MSKTELTILQHQLLSPLKEDIVLTLPIEDFALLRDELHHYTLELFEATTQMHTESSFSLFCKQLFLLYHLCQKMQVQESKQANTVCINMSAEEYHLLLPYLKSTKKELND